MQGIVVKCTPAIFFLRWILQRSLFVPVQGSNEILFAIYTYACFQIWECKDGTKLPSASLKRQIQSMKTKISVYEIAREFITIEASVTAQLSG